MRGDETGGYLEQTLQFKPKKKAAKKAALRFRVECLECGKRFSTSSMVPECPRCHGVDIDVE